MGGAILDWVMKTATSKEETSEQIPDSGNRTSYVKIWKKCLSG